MKYHALHIKREYSNDFLIFFSNFNQIWQKSSFGKGDIYFLLNEGPDPFVWGESTEELDYIDIL